MPSTYTTSNRFELQADGENSATWGQKQNTVTQLIDVSLDGWLAKSVAGAADVTLTTANSSTDEARNRHLRLTGTITANINVIVPNVSKSYIVWNDTSGNFTVTIKTLTGTGVAVPQGKRSIVSIDPATGNAIGVLVIGSNVQAWTTTLDALGGLSLSADRVPYFSSSAAASSTAFTLAARQLVGQNDVVGMRAFLNVGELTFGAWTPTIAGSGTPGNQSYAANVGNYARIGNLVYVNCAIQLSAFDSGTETGIRINGLPFPSIGASTTQAASVGYFGFINLSANYEVLGGVVEGSIIRLLQSGSGVGEVNLLNSNMTGNSRLSLSAWYRTS